MSFNPDDPFATVIPLYSGEVEVRMGQQSLRLLVPPTYPSPGTPPTGPGTTPGPGDPPSKPPGLPPVEPVRTLPPDLPPFEPAAEMITLGTGDPVMPDLAAYLKVHGGNEYLAGLLSEDQFRGRPEVPEPDRVHILGSAPFERLESLIDSPAFDAGGRGNLVFQASGPVVDLSAFSAPIAAARERGGEVVVLVYPPSNPGVPRWPSP